jgi:hypothetical protein
MPDKVVSDILDAVEAREIMNVFKLSRQLRELGQPRRRLNSVWFDPTCMVKVDGELEPSPASSSVMCAGPTGFGRRPPSCASTAPAACPSIARSSAAA